MTIAVGARVPDATFVYIPYNPDLDDLATCGIPSTYDITKEWAEKRVLLFSVPGAFTPTCHKNHLPGYRDNIDKIKSKGMDIVAVVAANDPFVMSGWARVEGLKDKIISLSDNNAEWSKKLGLSIDLTNHGLGIRTGRYALVLEDLVVKHIQVEENPSQVGVSGAENLLALL